MGVSARRRFVLVHFLSQGVRSGSDAVLGIRYGVFNFVLWRSTAPTLGGGSDGDLGFDVHAHRGLARGRVGLGGDISHTRNLFGDDLLDGSFGDRACCGRLARGRFG